MKLAFGNKKTLERLFDSKNDHQPYFAKLIDAIALNSFRMLGQSKDIQIELGQQAKKEFCDIIRLSNPSTNAFDIAQMADAISTMLWRGYDSQKTMKALIDFVLRRFLENPKITMLEHFTLLKKEAQFIDATAWGEAFFRIDSQQILSSQYDILRNITQLGCQIFNIACLFMLGNALRTSNALTYREIASVPFTLANYFFWNKVAAPSYLTLNEQQRTCLIQNITQKITQIFSFDVNDFKFKVIHDNEPCSNLSALTIPSDNAPEEKKSCEKLPSQPLESPKIKKNRQESPRNSFSKNISHEEKKAQPKDVFTAAHKHIYIEMDNHTFFHFNQRKASRMENSSPELAKKLYDRLINSRSIDLLDAAEKNSAAYNDGSTHKIRFRRQDIRLSVITRPTSAEEKSQGLKDSVYTPNRWVTHKLQKR